MECPKCGKESITFHNPYLVDGSEGATVAAEARCGACGTSFEVQAELYGAEEDFT